MTTRASLTTTVVTAQATNIASNIAADAAFQESINSAGNLTVAICSNSGNGTIVTKTNKAAATRQAAYVANAAVAIASVDVGKDGLKSAGDVGPV